MRVLFAFMFCLFLSSCASRHEAISIPQFSQKNFSISTENKSYILSVNRLDKGVKFILFDGFGAPVARRFLTDNKFKNDGFLPPNSKYDELFVAILEFVKSSAKTTTITLFNERFLVRQLDDISI